MIMPDGERSLKWDRPIAGGLRDGEDVIVLESASERAVLEGILAGYTATAG